MILAQPVHHLRRFDRGLRIDVDERPAGPRPVASAILSRHPSTILRALVRPFSRSPASSARVGTFGMISTFRHRRSLIDYSLGQAASPISRSSNAELSGFTMRIERQRPRYAAARRAGHDEIQRRNVGQLVAHHLALDHAFEMGLDPRAGDLREQQRIILGVIGDHRDVGGVALQSPVREWAISLRSFVTLAPRDWMEGFASSRGNLAPTPPRPRLARRFERALRRRRDRWCRAFRPRCRF